MSATPIDKVTQPEYCEVRGPWIPGCQKDNQESKDKAHKASTSQPLNSPKPQPLNPSISPRPLNLSFGAAGGGGGGSQMLSLLSRANHSRLKLQGLRAFRFESCRLESQAGCGLAFCPSCLRCWRLSGAASPSRWCRCYSGYRTAHCGRHLTIGRVHRSCCPPFPTWRRQN